MSCLQRKPRCLYTCPIKTTNRLPRVFLQSAGSQGSTKKNTLAVGFAVIQQIIPKQKKEPKANKTIPPTKQQQKKQKNNHYHQQNPSQKPPKAPTNQNRPNKKQLNSKIQPIIQQIFSQIRKNVFAM